MVKAATGCLRGASGGALALSGVRHLSIVPARMGRMARGATTRQAHVSRFPETAKPKDGNESRMANPMSTPPPPPDMPSLTPRDEKLSKIKTLIGDGRLAEAAKTAIASSRPDVPPDQRLPREGIDIVLESFLRPAADAWVVDLKSPQTREDHSNSPDSETLGGSSDVAETRRAPRSLASSEDPSQVNEEWDGQKERPDDPQHKGRKPSRQASLPDPAKLNRALEFVRTVVLTCRTDPSSSTWSLLFDLCVVGHRTADLFDISLARWSQVAELTVDPASEYALDLLRDCEPLPWRSTDPTVGIITPFKEFATAPKSLHPNVMPLPILRRRARKAADAYLESPTIHNDPWISSNIYVSILRAGINPAPRTTTVLLRALSHPSRQAPPSALATFSSFSYRAWLATWKFVQHQIVTQSQAKKLTPLLDNPDRYCGGIRVKRKLWMDQASPVTIDAVSKLCSAASHAVSRGTPTKLTSDMISRIIRVTKEGKARPNGPGVSEKAKTTVALRGLYVATRRKDRDRMTQLLKYLQELGVFMGRDGKIERVVASARRRDGEQVEAAGFYKEGSNSIPERPVHFYHPTEKDFELPEANLELDVLDSLIAQRDWSGVRDWVARHGGAATATRPMTPEIDASTPSVFVPRRPATLTALLESLHRADLHPAATLLVRSAAAMTPSPLSTYTHISHALWLFSRGEDAEAFEAIRALNGALDGRAYHALVAVLVRRGRWDDALGLIREALWELGRGGSFGVGRFISDVLWAVSGGVGIGGVKSGTVTAVTGVSQLVISGGHVAAFRENPGPPEGRVEPDGTVLVRVEEAVQRMEEVLKLVRKTLGAVTDGAEAERKQIKGWRSRDTNLMVRMFARSTLEIVERERLAESRRMGGPLDDDMDQTDTVAEDSIYRMLDEEDEVLMEETADGTEEQTTPSIEPEYPPSAYYLAQIRELTDHASDRYHKFSFPAVRRFLWAISVASADPTTWTSVLEYLVSRELKMEDRWAEMASQGVALRAIRSSFVGDAVRRTILDLGEEERWTALLRLWMLVKRCEVRHWKAAEETKEVKVEEENPPYPLMHYVLGDPEWAHTNFFSPLLMTMGRHESAVGHVHWMIRSCMQGPHPYPLSPDTYLLFVRLLGRHAMWGDLLDACTYWLMDFAQKRRFEVLPITIIGREHLDDIVTEAHKILEDAERTRELATLRSWWDEHRIDLR
ncbi:hypothetical protein M427DRAFT_64161 [Gonapodya prolifera JEL478]|uniref:Uncharacterized protein n=1 Tax=Gonapodya prolifera (strain JEL478) TaxID=1344416 RepID=A0A138ZY58_GONPJ|nr:hypothetical protein M427DRAFT_64161 [Gonapodya prolifera JEL478]|eukprot:KXS09429.1 hypothetical protein M427DRAFT_64161 [Gonapodya prolifera JEL478]